jgi:nitroreductase
VNEQYNYTLIAIFPGGWMDTFEAIRKRRSVRQYTGALISREDLLQIADAGRLAASGHNRQPWEFIIVTDRALIAQLKVASNWLENSAAVIAVVMDPTSRWWMEDGSAAVQNMLIAATALGYGSCWLEGYTIPREEEFKTLLHIPSEKRLFTLVALGVPVAWPVKEKKPLEAVVFWEHYPEVSETIQGDPTP